MDQATFDDLQLNFEQLCRYCASDGPVFPIFVEIGGEKVLNEERNIGVLLTQGYVEFDQAESCRLPKFICDDCIDGLQRWHQLREKIEHAATIFGEFLERRAQQIATGKDELEGTTNALEETTEEFYLVEYLNERIVDCDAPDGMATPEEGSPKEKNSDGEDSVRSYEDRSGDTELKVATNRDKRCRICGVLVKAKMKHHLMRHADPAGRPFKCEQCDKCYSYKRTLVNHVHQAHDNVKYRCDECGKLCASKEILRMHKKLHTEGVEHTCDVCGKSFKQHIYLKKHMVIHEEVAKFSCNYCSKRFRFKALLMQHHRVHTGEKPYPCELCTKTFRSITNRRQHKLTHLEEKPYKCVHCNSTYSSKRALDRHKLIHRPVNDRDGTVLFTPQKELVDQVVDATGAFNSASGLAVGNKKEENKKKNEK